MGLPAFLELNGVAHDPTQDRARGNAYSQLPSQFGEVAVAELETQIPAHASDDDVVGEPALTKERVTGGAMGNHAPSLGITKHERQNGEFIPMTAHVGTLAR
jgi:hypothetical protein